MDAAAAKEVERTERTDWERRGLLVAGAGGSDHDHPVVGDTDVLGVCPGEGDAPENAEDLVPDAEACDVAPDRLDHARELVPWNGLSGPPDAESQTHEEPETGVSGAPDPDVAGNHGGGVHLDQELVGAWRWLVHLHQPQYIR